MPAVRSSFDGRRQPASWKVPPRSSDEGRRYRRRHEEPMRSRQASSSVPSTGPYRPTAPTALGFEVRGTRTEAAIPQGPRRGTCPGDPMDPSSSLSCPSGQAGGLGQQGPHTGRGAAHEGEHAPGGAGVAEGAQPGQDRLRGAGDDPGHLAGGSSSPPAGQHGLGLGRLGGDQDLAAPGAGDRGRVAAGLGGRPAHGGQSGGQLLGGEAPAVPGVGQPPGQLPAARPGAAHPDLGGPGGVRGTPGGCPGGSGSGQRAPQDGSPKARFSSRLPRSPRPTATIGGTPATCPTVAAIRATSAGARSPARVTSVPTRNPPARPPTSAATAASRVQHSNAGRVGAPS